MKDKIIEQKLKEFRDKSQSWGENSFSKHQEDTGMWVVDMNKIEDWITQTLNEVLLDEVSILKSLPDIDKYVEDYEVRGDEGDYMPSDDEKLMIKDCLIGYVDDTPKAILSLQQPKEK